MSNRLGVRKDKKKRKEKNAVDVIGTQAEKRNKDRNREEGEG